MWAPFIYLNIRLLLEGVKLHGAVARCQPETSMS